jgi:V/A-type H+-transporting ATPase subunit I
LFAALCGWLYGSVFSYEHLLPALWFHPTAHIMKLFGMTILMGAIFIMVGLGVNIFNSILNGDYAEAFLEKRGLAVLILYISIFVFAVRYVMTGRMPAEWAIAVFVVVPLVLFSLRGILGAALFSERKDPQPSRVCC